MKKNKHKYYINKEKKTVAARAFPVSTSDEAYSVSDDLGLIVGLFQNEHRTHTNFVGVAKCHDLESFNEAKGCNVARIKADIKLHRDHAVTYREAEEKIKQILHICEKQRAAHEKEIEKLEAELKKM